MEHVTDSQKKKESLLTISNTAASVFRDQANSCTDCAYLCTVCSEVVDGFFYDCNTNGIPLYIFLVSVGQTL